MLSLCIWLLAVGKAFADNTLSVANVTIPQGGQATLNIVCNLSTTFVGFQLDLELPDDGKLTPVMSKGKPIANLCTNTDHSISSSQLKDNNQNLLPKYRFIVTSGQNSELPTSGTLMSIVLNASDNAVVNDVYHVKLRGIEFGTSNNTKDNLDDVSFDITIGAPLLTVELDEELTTAPTASNGAVNVTVKRKINANEWSTICLPFDMSEAQVKMAFGNDVKLADFTSWSFEGTAPNVNKITIGFTDATEIEANYPCIIKVSEAITSFSVKNVVINPDQDPQSQNKIFTVGSGKSAIDYKGTMYGVYYAKKTDEKDLFLANNQFWYSNGNTSIKAYRATFWFQQIGGSPIVLNSYNGGSSRIVMSFNDSETTAIGGALSLNDKEEMRNEKYYNLSGQQVKTPAKGVYVKDGKKVIFK